MNYFLIQDIDECAADTDGCDHICMNTPGSYTCSCNSGYNLLTDGHTCTGIATLINAPLNCDNTAYMLY